MSSIKSNETASHMVTGEFLKGNRIKEMEGGPSVPGRQFVSAPSFAAHFDLALGDVFLLSSRMVPRFCLPRIYSALLHYGRLCTHLISFIELEAPWRGKILLATFFNLQQQILWKKIKKRERQTYIFEHLLYSRKNVALLFLRRFKKKCMLSV